MTPQRPRPAPPSIPTLPPLPAPCLPLRILLATDQVRDAHRIHLGFRACDIPVKVHHVPHGRAALDFLLDPANPRPDGVLLDLHMPEMGGLECLAALQADRALSSLPVIMLCADCSAAEMAAARAGGVHHLVDKPGDLLMFFAVVGSLLPYLLDWQRSREPSQPHVDGWALHA